MTDNIGTGPFEDLGDEHVVTLACPICDTLHPRDAYVEVRQERRNGAIVRIYRCPEGNEVELDMTVQVPSAPEEPIYVELSPERSR